MLRIFIIAVAANLAAPPPLRPSDRLSVFSPPRPSLKVLLCMAEQMGKLTAHVGGNQYAHELLVPLEQLAAVEESTVSVVVVVVAAA